MSSLSRAVRRGCKKAGKRTSTREEEAEVWWMDRTLLDPKKTRKTVLEEGHPCPIGVPSSLSHCLLMHPTLPWHHEEEEVTRRGWWWKNEDGGDDGSLLSPAFQQEEAVDCHGDGDDDGEKVVEVEAQRGAVVGHYR